MRVRERECSWLAEIVSLCLFPCVIRESGQSQQCSEAELDRVCLSSRHSHWPGSPGLSLIGQMPTVQAKTSQQYSLQTEGCPGRMKRLEFLWNVETD